ncbi:hypothetical protein L7F22_024118 [Adiantum nelumboides]|nr:hypothetical protein [Adiantum nelumboides]
MRFEFSHHASVSYWISTADRMNKDFFTIHRERSAGISTRAIRDGGGALHTHPDQVLAIATDYYEELFTAESLTDDILEAREHIWSSIHSRVINDMRFHLMAPFTIAELRDAVHSLAPSSCPGDDGLTRGFFVTHWEILHVWLLRGFHDIFSSGCFVQDRCILDNIFGLHQAIEWARASSSPLAILLLDFEKAYDRLDWGFLEGSLIKMGFPWAWIRGVSALYRSASSSVTIGHVGRGFELWRSVRQSCPLAPYLFLFVAEAMSDFIRVHQLALRGLLMPVSDEPDLIDQEYADDTLLFFTRYT